uniref:Uncharacterized protein n=1 Tax=Zooxanthella nutricula TaxID=1333877 RepID=A0A7S2K5Z1_9DINO|mmetsp:Transcript_43266/g.130745  ORF Transcript_43266/g.130745 Transcript_43266/m.130745 type:complete len:279 (+) Transcript_43266:293-1129(+)
MVMETYVALAYKHLAVDHYVFKLLEPVSGDVGFLNRSWGVEFLIRNADGAYNDFFKVFHVASNVSLTQRGLLDQILRAKENFLPEDWFWFDEGGYMRGGCGVKESTSFAFRDSSNKIFGVILEWTRSVVAWYWQEDDARLQSWWTAIWWKQMAVAHRELSKDSLSHLVATCIFNATHNHDQAHDRWLQEHHQELVWGGLRQTDGSRADPSFYLPSAQNQMQYSVAMMGLTNGNLESPLLSYRGMFDTRLGSALKSFEDGLVEIVMSTPYVNRIGSMTH